MNPAKPITILLAEDHVILRQGLCSLFKCESRFQIVGEANNGREAVLLARTLIPDIILMDIAMPVLNGFEATRQILASRPASKIVVLSARSDDECVNRLKKIGICGFLEKETSAEILIFALNEVFLGRTYFSPPLSRRLDLRGRTTLDRSGRPSPNSSQLSPRESEVLQLVAEGSANKQIAAELSISIKTVEKHRQRLMNKLGIHETAGLTRYAIDSGVIESTPRRP